ncbi:GNAT family N-acetyltransferase [Rhodopila sp.]|uniref:GNAT family N-acetyltransferase n=1 Tax=Rhodopila sp. TaxID=2480087 RepID=UPI003D0DA04D
MSTNVRAAAEADLDALVQLNQVVQTLPAMLYPDDFKLTPDQSALRAFFAAQLANPRNTIGMAEADHVPVGYAWFKRQSRPETPLTPARSRIYLHHISVVQEARRRGIAAALMRYLEHQAALESVDEIALGTWVANLDAQHFFASQGFAPFSVAHRKRLSRVT